MITIIRRGNIESTDTSRYVVTCDHCNCLFVAAGSDFKVRMVGHGDYDEMIHCPYCGRELGKRCSEIERIN